MPARRELDAAVRYYNLQRVHLGNEFRDEAWQTIQRIKDFPLAWHPVRNNPPVPDAAFPVWAHLRAFGIGDSRHSCGVSPSRAGILALEDVKSTGQSGRTAMAIRPMAAMDRTKPCASSKYLPITPASEPERRFRPTVLRLTTDTGTGQDILLADTNEIMAGKFVSFGSVPPHFTPSRLSLQHDGGELMINGGVGENRTLFSNGLINAAGPVYIPSNMDTLATASNGPLMIGPASPNLGIDGTAVFIRVERLSQAFARIYA